jgi:hypothetical protein
MSDDLFCLASLDPFIRFLFIATQKGNSALAQEYWRKSKFPLAGTYVYVLPYPGPCVIIRYSAHTTYSCT